jgi:predicted DCC family thiol-disulfide oxidoreductase YuxK
MTGVLFFGEACGMCTRARDFLVSHDRTGNVETEPLQGAGVAERLGIPHDRLLEAMRRLSDDGSPAIATVSPAQRRIANRIP